MQDDPLAVGPPRIFIQLREPPGTSGGDPFQCQTDAPVFAALRSLAGGARAVRAAGETLFVALNSPKTQPALTAALLVQSPDSWPVYLDMGRHAALHQLPWEALCAPAGFLALDARWPVGRIVSGPRPTGPTWALHPPLRIAAILSCLNVSAAEEWGALLRALEPAGRAQKVVVLLLVSEPDLYTSIQQRGVPPWLELAMLPPGYPELQARIASFLPHVLHFFCHGSASYGPHLEVAVASDWLSGQPNNSHILEPKGIRDLTAATEDLPWLIVLNACESAAVAGDADTGAQSVAVALVHDGVPAVVGMREPVLSSDAARFTRTFYGNLAATLDPALNGTERELTVDWAMLTVGAREELCRDRNGLPPDLPPREAAARTKEWTLPVVHVRPAPFVVNVPDPARPPAARSEQLESTIIDVLLAALPAGTPDETVEALRAELERRKPPGAT